MIESGFEDPNGRPNEHDRFGLDHQGRHPEHRKRSGGQRERFAQLQQKLRGPDEMKRDEQHMHNLHMLAEKQPSVIEVTAKSLAMREIPEMFFVHGGIAVRDIQREVHLPVHPDESHDIQQAHPADNQHPAMRRPLGKCGFRL